MDYYETYTDEDLAAAKAEAEATLRKVASEERRREQMAKREILLEFNNFLQRLSDQGYSIEYLNEELPMQVCINYESKVFYFDD